MKKSIILIALFFFLSSCTEEQNGTTLRINFPERAPSSSSRLLSKNFSENNQSQWNGQVNSLSDVDCFGVLIGGEEENFKRNNCSDLSTGTTFIEFGDYFAALDRNGDTLEIEIESGVEREITIIAMDSNDNTCVNFQGFSPIQGQLSHPRVLYRQRLTFDPGDQTLDVTVPSTFSSSETELGQCEFDSTEEPPTSGSTASLNFATNTTYDFGSITAGATANTTFTISNFGNGEAFAISETSLASPFQFLGGAFPGTGGTCTSSLAAGSSCTLAIEFAPATAAVHTGSITLSFFDGSQTSSISRNIQGTALPLGLLQISGSDPYDYGTLPTGATTSQSFTVTNIGLGLSNGITEIGLAAPFGFLGGSYPGTGGDCGVSLANGASCTIVISYSPTVVSALDSDTIDLSYNDGMTTVSSTRNVRGVAVTPASLTITGTDPYDYGLIANGGTTNHTFTITNTGGYPASSISEVGLSAPFAFQGGSFPGTGGTCSTTINGGSSCNIVIAFSPTATGAFADTIDLNYNDGNAIQTVTRNVQGTGGAPANITITETDPYDYGNVTVGSNSNHIFTLTNTGAVAANSITTAGLGLSFTYTGGSYPGTAGDCGTTLNAGANCNVDITFAPTTTGLKTNTFSIIYNDGASSQTSSRDVRGTGLTPANLTFTPSTHFFGSTGGTLTFTFTVTNSGGSTATSISDSFSSGVHFGFTGVSYPGTAGTCTASLASAASCTIELEFSPITSGTFNDVLTLNYNNGAATSSSTLTISGIGI